MKKVSKKEDRHLGNPEVVNRLVAEFCCKVENYLRDLDSKKLTPAAFRKDARRLVMYYSRILGGKDESYTFVKGYNDRTLRMKLRADLGKFWVKNHDNWANDEVAVLLEWLFVMIAQAVKQARGDEFLYEVILKPSVSYTVKVLLSIEERYKSDEGNSRLSTVSSNHAKVESSINKGLDLVKKEKSMSNFIKDLGGLTVRLIEAINGFKTKFGYWPSLIEMDESSISLLLTKCLTPLGLFLLQSKVDLVIGDDYKIIAKGRMGDIFDYGEEGWSSEHQHDARIWLGWNGLEDEK